MNRLQLLLLPVIVFVNELDKVLKDGKISFIEAIGMIPETAALAAVWPEMKNLKAEYEDLPANEQAMLLDFIANKLTLESDTVEDIVLIALDTVNNLYLLKTLVQKARV